MAPGAVPPGPAATAPQGAPAKVNGLAVSSLATGSLGILLASGSWTTAHSSNLPGAVPLLLFLSAGTCSVLALIFGLVARNEMAKWGGRQGGRWMANTAIALGACGIALLIALLIVAVLLIAGSTASHSS